MPVMVLSYQRQRVAQKDVSGRVIWKLFCQILHIGVGFIVGLVYLEGPLIDLVCSEDEKCVSIITSVTHRWLLGDHLLARFPYGIYGACPSYLPRRCIVLPLKTTTILAVGMRRGVPRSQSHHIEDSVVKF
jgi:hypothetical protein